MKWRWVLLCNCFPALLFAQSAKSLIREGNSAYDGEAYDSASTFYKKALNQNQERFDAWYNLGDALYKQDSFATAQGHFEQALTRAESPQDRADAYHNLGNIALRQKKWDDAIGYFKQSLLHKPGVHKTQYNLSYALKQKADQSQQNNQNQQKSNQPKPSDDTDESEQNPNGEDGKQEPQQNQDESLNKDQPEEGQQSTPKNDNPSQNQQENGKGAKPTDALSDEEIERVLQAIRRKEQKVQEKLLRRQLEVQPNKSDKEW